jgi:16S rRNA (guanine(966)-N(2))-methyltransferase RsmD
LLAPPGDAVRPTTDRTKEALFSILGADVAGAWVVDLCCGAGGLGIEALSRGARQAIFVDVARGSLRAAEANLKRCGAGPDSWSLQQCDAGRWLDRWAGTGGDPWLLLCDPPYASPVGAALMRQLGQPGVPPGLVCAVVEHGAGTPAVPARVSAGEAGWGVRRYGASRLAIFRPGATAPATEGSP